MTTTWTTPTPAVADPQPPADRARRDRAAQSFTHVLRAEWIKFWSVRSTRWSLVALVAMGIGLTVLVSATSAESIADGSAGEAPESFVTWGMMIAQVTAVVLGALYVTSEYGTGLVRATFAAVPRRGRVVAAKLLVLCSVLFVAGTLTATVGYVAGNWFLEAEGVGVPLDGDGVIRSLYGNGLYLAALGALTLGVGLLVRHTAAALSIVLGLVFVVANMAFLLPGSWGETVADVIPGNAGHTLTTPVAFNPTLMDAWPGFAVLVAEVAVVVALGWLSVLRRDA